VRDLSDESALEITVVDVELSSTRRRIALRHVLPNDLDWLGTLDEHRAQVADERRQKIAFLERKCTSDGIRLLT
jgi:hypothetical protein